MIRVFIADTRLEERTAIRRLIQNLNLEVAGESGDWPTTLSLAPKCQTNMLVVEWDLLPNEPSEVIAELRRVCPASLVIVLLSGLDARQQAALSAGADAFISKNELPERVVERLRTIATSITLADQLNEMCYPA